MPVETVYIIEDDLSTMSLLRRTVASLGWQSSTFATAEGFLDAVRPEARGCVLVDQTLPGMSGVELQAEARRRGFTLPMIFLTAETRVEVIVAAMKAGAVDLIAKPVGATSLEQAISHAMGKDRASATRRAFAEQIDALSGRERDVLRGMLAGLANKRIGQELRISQRTVEVYRARLLAKLAPRTLPEIATLVAGLQAAAA